MLVTIYMPTKDRLELLRRAVASVLAQTHGELELIVVNDGSTDGTRAWLDALAAGDARVQAIHHDTPRGAPAARNAALRRARGAWVTGLDDDDEFLPARLERLLAEAARLDAAGERYAGLYTLEHIVSPARRYTLAKPASTGLRDLFRYNSIGNQLFARREQFLAVGGFDEAMPAWQDLDLFMRLVDRFGPARLVAEPLYLLADDDRSDRISKKKKGKMLDAYARLVAKWPQQPARLKQRLYLQLLAPFYGFPFEWADLRRFFGMGVDVPAMLALVRLLARRRMAPSH